MATASVLRTSQFYSEPVVSTTDAAGVIGKIGFDFGFLASSVAFFNDKLEPVYISLDSTTGSTGGFKLAAGASISFSARAGGASLASTTTSTGTIVRTLALGG